MATDIPPHNIEEIGDACIKILSSPKLKTAELLEVIKGPDFPTGGLITPEEDLISMYETGVGTLKIRAPTKSKKRNNNR